MKSIGALALAIVLTIASINPASAILCYALTDANQLLAFDSATPGTVTTTAITGLGANTLVGMDMRTTVQTTGAANPGVNSLWALGTNGITFQLFVINKTTGAATPIGAPLVGIDGSGGGDNGWFFGFDPGTDRIRMMNFFRNYEANPNTATFVQQANLTGFPNLNGSAFETASFGEDSDIYFLEQTGDALYTSANIASGSYSIVGAGTGVNFSIPAGLDIFNTTTLMAAVDGVANLYSVNRTTGTAALIGAIGGNPTIRALVIQPTSFPPKLPVTIKVKGPKKITTTRARATVKGTAKSDAGIAKVEYRIGKGKFKKAKGTKKWTVKAKLKPGVNKLQVRAVGGNDVESKPAKVKIIRRSAL